MHMRARAGRSRVTAAPETNQASKNSCTANYFNDSVVRFLCAGAKKALPMEQFGP
jgi:hypothetical protein